MTIAKQTSSKALTSADPKPAALRIYESYAALGVLLPRRRRSHFEAKSSPIVHVR
jgi:hypothetical protein